MPKQGEQHTEFMAIGQIVGVHGIRGEVKVDPMTDYPERFRAGALVWLGKALEASDTRQLEIEAARPHKKFWLVKFAQVADRNAAEFLREQMVMIPLADAMPLGQDENYVHDLIGLVVETNDGRPLGTLREVMTTAANDVYVVQGDGGEVLIPALREVVLNVDIDGGRMVVALPEGLID